MFKRRQLSKAFSRLNLLQNILQFIFRFDSDTVPRVRQPRPQEVVFFVFHRLRCIVASFGTARTSYRSPDAYDRKLSLTLPGSQCLAAWDKVSVLTSKLIEPNWGASSPHVKYLVTVNTIHHR